MTAWRSAGSEKTNILMRMDLVASAIASRMGCAESSGKTIRDRDMLLLLRLMCLYFIRTRVELGSMKIRIETVFCHKFVVGAAFGDDSPRDDDDLVGVADSTEPVGDSNHGLALHQLFKRIDDELFGFAVQSGGRLVEQKDRAVADHDAG